MNTPPGKSSEICFGWNRQTDETSLAAFLERFSQDELMKTILPRLSDQELSCIVDLLSDLMRRHLSGKEYHRLFLREE